MTDISPTAALTHFLEIMAALRNPRGGCPWDLKQTLETLKPLVIEEAYEVADAVADGPLALCEELGDLVSLIGLFAQIASEQSLFSFSSILNGISDKLVRRHPHVFADTQVSNTEEVLRNWEQIKQQERKSSAAESPKGLLDGIPRSLPALLKAHQIGARCARVGFDWTSRDGVANKIREELGEFLKEAQATSTSTMSTSGPNLMAPAATEPSQSEQQLGDRAFEEFGDLLFTLAQYARHMGFNAEEALQQANAKFSDRFRHVELLSRRENGDKPILELSPAQLEELWKIAKMQIP